MRTEAPFLDSRFLQYSARLTPEQRQNGRLHLRAHNEIFARSSQVPRANDGNAPKHLNHAYWSGDSSYLRQLTRLAISHPVSAGRRGARQARRMASERLVGAGVLANLGNRAEARRSVFPADVWLRTSPTYRERLLGLLGSSSSSAVLSGSALDRLTDDLRAGRTEVGALMIAKIASLQRWLADYDRRNDQCRTLTAGRV